METNTAKEIAKQVESYVIERGQSQNSLDLYHYILSVFIQFCEKYNNGIFTKELGKRCLNEHYGVSDINAQLDRHLSHTKAAVRVI